MTSYQSYQSFDEKSNETFLSESDFFIISIPEECCICLEKQKEKELTILRCKHTFHQKCMTKWLENNRTCPMCRTYIPEDQSGNEVNPPQRSFCYYFLWTISPITLCILGGIFIFLYVKY